MPMNPTLQRYLLSSLTTALTVGLGSIAVQLSVGPIMWTATFWLTVVSIALRAAFKAIVEGYAGQNGDLPSTPVA